MGGPSVPWDGTPWTFVSFRTTVKGKETLDRLRGPQSRSVYLRSLIEQAVAAETERKANRRRALRLPPTSPP
jgi:hypothetical protein